MWAEAWTADLINASNFGITFSVKKQGGGANPELKVDHVKITITFVTSLQIELNLFTASSLNDAVELSWQTAS